MPTVAEIADLAFDGVSGAIPDAVHTATLAQDTQGAYSTATASYAVSTATQTGRVVVDTVTPASDLFPDYVAGPADELLLLEGFTSCAEGNRVTFQGRTKTVKLVQDIVGAGTLFYALCR